MKLLAFIFEQPSYSTLYTTLSHDLIKDKLIDLIEKTFAHEMTEMHFYLGMT